MYSKLKKINDALHVRILYSMDHHWDMSICNQDLTGYVKSIYRDDKNSIGFTGSQSTHYCILSRIFSYISFSSEDSFIDVGCGKGRVLAFLLKEKCPCNINGIEINEISGNIAKNWTQKYENVHVMIGDAFKLNYDQYTVLFLGRPFLPVTFLEYIELLEKQLTHPITFIYWVDQQSGPLLRNRSGWTLKHREVLFRIHGLKIAVSPQGFSIWEYDPKLRET